MKKLFLAAAVATVIPFAAQAQDTTAPPTTDAPTTTEYPAATTEETTEETLPFGIEPYVGVGGGYHSFDEGTHGEFNLGNGADGALITAFAGVHVPFGILVVGAEGNVAKGFSDIDWEYGVTGHVGLRAGESGMIFARAGSHWIEGKRGYNDDRNEIYGMGVEVGDRKRVV